MSGDSDKKLMIAARLTGNRVTQFEAYKDAIGAASDSDGIRQAVDTAHAAEIEVGAHPHELQSRIERLEGENDQLRERLDEHTNRLQERDHELERLRSTSPLGWFRNLAFGVFSAGAILFFGLIFAESFFTSGLFWNETFNTFVLVSFIGIVAGIGLIATYGILRLAKAAARQQYDRAAHYLFTHRPLRWVVNSTWIPEKPNVGEA